MQISQVQNRDKHFGIESRFDDCGHAERVRHVDSAAHTFQLTLKRWWRHDILDE